MSEYQYYEFRAIDRGLTAAEIAELRRFSTRARISSHRFVNEYEWGNFKGDADLWMERYFDTYFYFANWGTRVFKLRFPSRLLSAEVVSPYCGDGGLSFDKKNEDLIVTFECDEDEYACDDLDGSFFSTVISIRRELMRGDLRSLYLGWLYRAQQGYLDDEEIEPPVPPGLRQLTEPQEALMDFLGLDRALFDAAAQACSKPAGEPARDEIQRFVAALPMAEENRLLADLLADPDKQTVSAALRC